MTAWLRIALAAQLAFFGLWGGRLLTSHRDVAIVWLATDPVDPRDLLSGHYVALRYPIADAGTALCDVPAAHDAARTVWIELVERGETIPTPDGSATVSEPVRCVTEEPPSASGTWIRGILEPSGRIGYGIERMFVGEESPLRQARSGSVVAQVALNEVYEPRLLSLMQRHPPTAVPE